MKKWTFLSLLTLLSVAQSAFSAITSEIRRVSDDTLVTTGVNFQTVPNVLGISQGEHYLVIRYIQSDSDIDSFHVFSNNTQAPAPRDGLRHLPSFASKAPTYYKVFDSRQTGITMTAATRPTWNVLHDVNDSGFPHQRVNSYPTGTTYVYFAADVNSSNPVGSYEAQIKVKNYPFQITTHPNTQIILQGNSVTFGVAADGVPPLSYQWKEDNQNINGATSATYAFPVTLNQNLKVYKCEVRDGLNRVLTSNEATLIVVAGPIVVSQPQPQTVLEGQPASFSISVVGFPPPYYQWFRNSAAIPGANQPTYTMASTALSDNGALISCGVINDFGYVVSQQVLLTVQSAGAPPTITSHPQSQTIPQGSPVSFNVVAVGQDLSYQWFRDGSAISSANAATYSISSVQLTDNGVQFYCRVSNDHGSVNSNAATLTVTSPNTPPIIQVHPAPQFVDLGQSATFSVQAVSALPMTYQWQKNNVNISGALSASYTTPPTTMADNGSRYRCIVSNTVGSTPSNDATLLVIPQTVFYSLTVVNGTGSGSYVEGVVVSISANPAGPGLVFDRWVGAAVADPTSPTTTLTMPSAATTVTATYKAIGGGNPVNLGDGFGNFPKIFKPAQGESLPVTYRISKTSSVELTVYDRKGNRLKELVKQDMSAGEHQISWDGKLESSELASSGSYILVLKILNGVYKTKVVLLK